MNRKTLCAVSLSMLAAAWVSAASLQVRPSDVRAGDEIQVTYSAPAGLESAWVGIIASTIPHGDEAVNDANDVDYQYLDGSTQGTLIFEAPTRAGRWDARLNDGTGRELASASFTVIAPDLGQVSLQVLTPTVPPGGEVRVRFTAPDTLPGNAWIGLIPSSVPHGEESVNDENEVVYEYLDGRTQGVISFEGPAEPGSWDVRLNDTDDDGSEIASASFVVAFPDAAGSSVQLSRTTLLPGEELKVRFRTPGGFAERAWIGIVPSSVPHGSEEVNDEHDVDYGYLDGAREGVLSFLAPAEAGSWDVRMHDTDANGREVASATFVVKGEIAAEEMAAKLEAEGSLALYGIRFATDSAEITAESAKALAPVGQLLIRDPELELLIVGHTDSTGDAAHNLELSQRRAEAVGTYLVDTFGIDAGRLSSEGRGPEEPVATNETPAGRALNRRVELVRR